MAARVAILRRLLVRYFNVQVMVAHVPDNFT